MKLKIAPLILIILLTSFQIAFGQQKSKAILMDEFTNAGDEELSARIDGFLQNLLNESTSQAYIVIYPAKDSAQNNFRHERKYESFIESKISLQKYDKSRISIVRGQESDATKLELWKIPLGAEKPFTTVEKWREVKRDLTKPLIFGFTYDDEIFPNFVPEFYADYIKKNADLDGHIVVFNKSGKEGLREANEWIKTLTEEFKVPRHRLQVFFEKRNVSAVKAGKGNHINEEFWLVPRKKLIQKPAFRDNKFSR